MRTRIAHMVDTKTLEPRFGVQVQTRNGWTLVAVDGEVQALTEKAAAERLRAELSRRRRATLEGAEYALGKAQRERHLDC